MADSEESRPILMEDSELIRQRRTLLMKRIGVGVLAGCLVVGVCLAIALPLTMSSQQNEMLKSPAVMKRQLVGFAGSDQNVEHSRHKTATDPSITTQSPPTGPTERAVPLPLEHDHPHSSTESTSPTETTDEDEQHHHHHHRDHHSSTTGNPVDPTGPTTSNPSPVFENCPRANTSKARFDLKSVEGKTLYEVARVQTYHTPSYVYSISCSEITFNKATGYKAEFNHTWMEGRHRHSRCQRTAKVEIHSNGSPNEFTVNIVDGGDKSGVTGQLGVLAELDDYLLTFECYSEPQHGYDPGYVISVYSTQPLDRHERQVVEVLLDLADKWGFNPEDERVQYLKRHHCEDIEEC